MNRAIAIIVLWAGALHLCALPPQEVVMALRHRSAAAGTNIQFQGYAKFNTSSSSTSLSGAYTCASTSNRIIMIGEYQNTSVLTLTLTDTGGQASGATVILALTVINNTSDKAWNVGCASGSNTFTLTGNGSGSGIVIEILEYSGITSGAGSVTTFANTTGTPFTMTATNSSAGALTVVYVGMNAAEQGFHAITAPFNYRTTNTASGGDGGIITSYPVFDNINTPTGTVSFSMTSGGTPPSARMIMIFMPGNSATSPNWSPYVPQSTTACSNSGSALSVTMTQNVVAGHLMTVAFGSENTGTAPTSITDSRSTNYTLQVTQHVGGINAIWIYTGVPSSSGPDTITANGGGFSFPCIQGTEFSGPGGTVSDTASDNTSSNTMTWNQTVSTANSIVYAACKTDTGSAVQMGGIAFGSTSQASAGDTMGGSWARTTTTATVAPIFFLPSSSGTVCASIVSH